MQNGMITTPLPPPYFVPTSTILMPPSKSGKPHRRLVGRQVCRLGGGGGGLRVEVCGRWAARCAFKWCSAWSTVLFIHSFF